MDYLHYAIKYGYVFFCVFVANYLLNVFMALPREHALSR